MQAALKTGSVPVIPAPHETELFLLTQKRKPIEIIEKCDEEDNLTFVKHYSPTSD